jgi:hypothetical protein
MSGRQWQAGASEPMTLRIKHPTAWMELNFKLSLL